VEQWTCNEENDEHDEVPPNIEVEHSKNLGNIAVVISL